MVYKRVLAAKNSYPHYTQDTLVKVLKICYNKCISNIIYNNMETTQDRLYVCLGCGITQLHTTNNEGEIYIPCSNCVHMCRVEALEKPGKHTSNLKMYGKWHFAGNGDRRTDTQKISELVLSDDWFRQMTKNCSEEYLEKTVRKWVAEKRRGYKVWFKSDVDLEKVDFVQLKKMLNN